MDTAKIINILFENESGIALFHDAILDACDVSHNDETLKKLFYTLPISVQSIAFEWGLSDTVFRDAVFEHIQQDGKRYGIHENTSG